MSNPSTLNPAVQPILALLAYPVSANPTQYMVEKAFAHQQLDWRYLSLEVTADDLPDAVKGMRAMGFRGGTVADPHREAILPLLDHASDTATLIGAVNFILRDDDGLGGDNTEGRGLVEALRRVGDPAGRKYLILGAGQTGRAVAVELAAAGAAEIRIANRTASRGEELASLLAGKFPLAASSIPWEGDLQVPPDIDVLVNATPVTAGESSERLPIVTETLRPETIVADMTVEPPETRLLREAAARGCPTLDGLTALIEQVAISFRLWTVLDPDRQVLRDAVEEFLEL